MTNQLAVRDYGFGLIPKEGEKEFSYLMNFWYCASVEGEKNPTLQNNMFYHDVDARDCFLNFIDEIGTYLYVQSHFDEPNPSFPSKVEYYTDAMQDYFIRAYDDFIEFAFIGDMKKWMNHQSLFYIDQYDYEALPFHDLVETKYVNKPIVEVW